MSMTAEARAERARYMREWRKKHPEKQREYDAAKWERKAANRKREAGAENEGTQRL